MFSRKEVEVKAVHLLASNPTETSLWLILVVYVQAEKSLAEVAFSDVANRAVAYFAAAGFEFAFELRRVASEAV